MGIRKSLVIFIVFIFGLIPIFSSVSAEDVTIAIHMLGENARTRFDSPVIVAGIWHLINVTLNEHVSTELILKFYQGITIPAIGLRDESNYYEWKYNSVNQEWTDENEYSGYTYINDSNCQKNGNVYSFCVGVKDTFADAREQYENWTLEIYKDGNKLDTKNIVLETPIVGPAKYHADIIKFNVDPFTEMDEPGNDYFIVENVGNVPLDINVDYRAFNPYIDVTNSGKKLSPYNTFNFNITLHSDSWKPGILKISGTDSVIGSIPNYLIITTAAITFDLSQIISAADLEVYVGHSNYTIQEVSGTNIVFQYEKEFEMNEGQIKDVNVYISGEGDLTLDVLSDDENIQILKVSSKDQEGTPLTISSSNNSEYIVTIRVEALKENKVGKVYYNLKIGEEIHTFSTQITIGPPLTQQETSGGGIPTTTIVVAFCIILLIIYLIYTQIRHKRR